MKNRKNTIKYTPEQTALLQSTGSENREQSLAATHELAQAAVEPLRQGVMYGDILADIYTAVPFAPTATIEFPLDFLTPGTEKNFVAYTIPNHGYIPERHFEGDIVRVNTFEIAASIDWILKYARDARWDVFNRAMKLMRAQFTKKMNDDGFATILAAGRERAQVVYDGYAAPGTLSKRLITLMQQYMRRSYGGNSASTNRGRLTDLFLSPEALEDVRNWAIADIDEVTRREIFTSRDGRLNQIFGVTLHDLDELGDGQQYQDYFLDTLGGSMDADDEEIVVGLDLSNREDHFLMPIREELQIFEDENLHRQRRAGFYGWMELGFAVLDIRAVLIGSL